MDAALGARMVKRMERARAWRDRGRQPRGRRDRFLRMSPEERVCEIALEVIGRMPVGMWTHFMQQYGHLCERVQFFSHTQQRLTEEAVPWPLVFLLGYRGDKCILASGSAPSYAELHGALESFKRGVRTSCWAFRTFGRTDRPAPTLYARNLEWVPPDAPPDVERTLRCMENAASDAYTAACRAKGGRRLRFGGNITTVDRMAFRILVRRKLFAVRSDKDHKFCLLHERERAAVAESILDDTRYFSPAPHFDAKTCTDSYAMLALDVTDRDVPLRRFLLQDLGFVDARGELRMSPVAPAPPVSRIQFNIKTHKNPIEYRELDAQHRSPLKRGQMWVASHLRPAIHSQFPWVMKDSTSFLLAVSRGAFDWPPDFDLFSVDIKRFFPNTDQDLLVQDAVLALRGAGLPPALVNKLWAMTDFVVRHQFAVGEDKNTVYRRTRGVGMGHAAASELCDAHVAVRGDPVLLEAVRGGSVRWYLRFRDDGLMCVRRGTSDAFLRRLVDDFRTRTNGLELEVSPVREQEAVWLDLVLLRGPNNTIHTRTHIKATNSGLYLFAQSFHPRRVLLQWHKGELLRYVRGCNHFADVIPLVCRLHECLNRRGYSLSLEDMVQHARALHFRRTQLLEPVGRRAGQQRLCPLVLPYHRFWEVIGVPSILRRARDSLQRCFPDFQHVRMPLAYSNRRRHLHVYVRNPQRPAHDAAQAGLARTR
jgi:hypothetical protein